MKIGLANESSAQRIAKPRQRLRRWVIGALVSYIGLFIVLQVAAPTIDLPLPPETIKPETAKAYVVTITGRASFPYRLLSDVDGPEGSLLMLLVDGRPQRFAHSPHDAIRQHGGGRYSHWGNVVLFSTADGSDPRTNGHKYSVQISMRPMDPAVWFFLLIGTLALLLFVDSLPQLARVLSSRPVPPLYSTPSSNSIAASFVPIVIAALPSLILFSVVPPIYTDMTIADVTKTPAYILPHYPPLYAYFLFGIHEFANAICSQPSGLSDCGLFLMTAIQHCLLIAAIVYFSRSSADTLFGRLMAIIPFYFMPVFAACESWTADGSDLVLLRGLHDRRCGSGGSPR